MPFARVGAMPLPSRNDEQQSASGRGSRPNRKGITIMDLKKQTALRLAQEQHQGQGLSGSVHSETANPPTQPVDSKGRPVVTPETLAARSHSAPGFSNQQQAAASYPHHYQRLHHHHNAAGHQPNYGAEMSGTPNSYSGMPAGGRYYDQGSKHARKKGARPPASVTVPVNSNARGPVPVQASQHNAANRYHHDQRSQYSLSASVPTLPMNNPMPSNLGFDASSSNSTAAHSTSKLPHGLTVHELKEMTKARLQAEAAEKLIAGFSDRPPSTTSMTERDSQDSRSTTPANYVQQMYAQDVRPVGTLATDSTSPTEVDFGGRQHAQVSPPPVAYQSFYPPNSSFNNIQDQKFVMGNRSRVHSCPDTQWDSTGLLGNRDRLGSFPEVVGNRNRIESLPELPIGNRSRVESYRELQGNRNRLDSFPDSNWESASVTSHNSTVASDYLGSECAYSSGTGAFSQRNADDFLPLNRTQSFPVGSSRSGSQEGLPQDNPCTSTSPLGNYFDPSSGMMQQNRGRSLTLSPRPGLSFLHEDRPGFSEEELGIPSFASSRLARQQIANRSRASPVLHPEGLPADSFGGIGSSSSGYIGSYGDNRPRTSSAASLPAISHTSEEFGGDFRGSAIRSHETIQNASSSLGEGLYGSSGLYNSDSAALGGASSVFRERSGGLPAPPGLSHPNSTNYNSSSDLNPLSSSNMGSAYSRVSNRARAATWNPGCDVFSSGPGLYECSGDDNLEEDLASILKLSGAEENRQDTGRSGSMFSDGLFSGSNEFKENDSRSRKF